MKKMRIASTVEVFSLSIERPGGESGPAYLWLPVLPEGTFQHSAYGELNWTKERFARMIANHQAQVTGAVPMLNADHATHNPFAGEAPAYGWLEKLEAREDGLWAYVQLTDLGVEAIQNRRYRYTSAEVADVYGRETGAEYQDVICGLALTNTPHHRTMPGTFAAAADPELLALAAQTFATLEGDLSFDEIRCLLSEAIRGEVAHVPGVYRYVEEVFPAFVIYEEYGYAGGTEYERHYKRGYTVANRAVDLDAEIVEVEEVWVEKARQAFSAARKQAVRRLGAQPHNPADQAATERKSMSQAPAPKKPFGQMLREWFGLDAKATTVQLAEAIDSAPAPAAEPAENPTPDPGTAPATPAVELSSSPEVRARRAQLDATNKLIQELRQERQDDAKKLAAQNAETAIQGFVAQGKITPAMLEGEGGKALREFAAAQPAAFAELYKNAPQLVDLSRRGGLQPGNGSGDGQEAETFNALVDKILRENPGIDEADAVMLAGDERPDLYEATRPRKGGN